MATKPVRTALIGIGGFGRVHVSQLMSLAGDGLIELTAFSDVRPDANPEGWELLRGKGAVPYTDYKTMFDQHPELELAVIATPIHLHREMAVHAFERNVNVLLEKPPTASVAEMDAMLDVMAGSASLCQVNFMMTSGKAFRRLIERVREGAIGRLLDITGFGLWKRTQAYYARTPWAGKLAYNGNTVLDGTINNPLSHLLNNCIRIAAENGETPLDIVAELYHANDIESEDNACLRIRTDRGTNIRFYATLSHDRQTTPAIRVRGTRGEMEWDYGNRLTVRMGESETTTDFGEEDNLRNMYENVIGAIRNPGTPLYCPLDSCRTFVAAVNGAFISSGVPHPISDACLTRTEENGTVFVGIPGIESTLMSAAASGRLYSEAGVPWAVPGRTVDLRDVRDYAADRDRDRDRTD